MGKWSLYDYEVAGSKKVLTSVPGGEMVGHPPRTCRSLLLKRTCRWQDLQDDPVSTPATYRGIFPIVLMISFSSRWQDSRTHPRTRRCLLPKHIGVFPSIFLMISFSCRWNNPPNHPVSAPTTNMSNFQLATSLISSFSYRWQDPPDPLVSAPATSRKWSAPSRTSRTSTYAFL